MWGVCVCVRVGRTRLRVCEWVTCDPRGPLQVHLQPLRLVELGPPPSSTRGGEVFGVIVPRIKAPVSQGPWCPGHRLEMRSDAPVM